MKFIIGKKLNMTQIWKDDKVVPVTQIAVEPCIITQIKDLDKDGYLAVQVGTGSKKEKRIKKPQKGHFAKVKEVNKNIDSNFRYLKEFRISDNEELKIGEQIDINTFEAGDKVQATSVSKGKGFQGVVKRYGFSGGDKSHGNKDQLRMPGSIGATGPAHVFKGVRMGGRTGGDQVTIKNLEVVEVNKEDNVLLIKGAVSGHRNSLVLISGDGDLKLIKNEEDPKKEDVAKEPEEEVKENSATQKTEDNFQKEVEEAGDKEVTEEPEAKKEEEKNN